MTKNNNGWKWTSGIIAVLFIVSILFGFGAYEDGQKSVPACTECKICDKCENKTITIDTTPNYLALAKAAALEEFVDELDDDDVYVSYDNTWDVFNVEFDKDEPKDYVVYFKSRLELFNYDDYDDAEDDNEEYDAPLDTYDFTVKWDESREKFKVSWN